MTKAEIKSLVIVANTALANVPHAVKILTAENPLILFDDKIDSDDERLYELPLGYVIDKYENYNEGTVMKVQGNDVTLFMRGEYFGDIVETELDQLPFTSKVQILELIEERSAE